MPQLPATVTPGNPGGIMGDFEEATQSARRQLNELAPEQVAERFRHDIGGMVTQARNDLRELARQTSRLPMTAAEELLVGATTLPATRITDDDAKSRVTLEGSLKERKLALEGDGPNGIFALRLQGGQPADRLGTLFSPPHWRNWGYDLSATSSDEHSHLHLWSNRAAHAPYMNLSTRVAEGLRGNSLAVFYQRDESFNRVGLTASYQSTSFSVGHDFRKGLFGFSGQRQVGDYFKVGVNANLGPSGYYDFGAKLKIGN